MQGFVAISEKMDPGEVGGTEILVNGGKIFTPFGLSGAARDIITGGDGIDVVFGGGGNDEIDTFDGFDLVFFV